MSTIHTLECILRNRDIDSSKFKVAEVSNQTEESRSATHTQQLQLSLKRNISSLLSNSVHSSGCMVLTTAFQFKQFATAIRYSCTFYNLVLNLCIGCYFFEFYSLFVIIIFRSIHYYDSSRHHQHTRTSLRMQNSVLIRISYHLHADRVRHHHIPHS